VSPYKIESPQRRGSENCAPLVINPKLSGFRIRDRNFLGGSRSYCTACITDFLKTYVECEAYMYQKYVGLIIVSESHSMCLDGALIDAGDAAIETRGRDCHV
jgi:hypothetical protein